MKWLEVMDLDRPNALQEIQKSPKLTENLFKCARKLALYPENRPTLDLCHYFVKNTTDVLEELIIHANFDEPDPHDHSPNANTIDLRELNDTATGPGLISSTIFGHMMPFDVCEPFRNLKSLRLHRVNLRYCVDTWCKFVDFTKVTQLRVYQCPGVDSLLGQLCKASNLPKQLRTLEIQHKDNSDNEALIALDGFLCLVSGIKDLVVDMEHVKVLPAAAGIARHGQTLELLNVHCSAEGGMTTSPECDHEELVWESEDFEKIAKACSRLEQLSCAWPETCLVKVPDEASKWTAFERSCGNLRDLVTLHISTWPANKTSPHSSPLLPRPIYEQLLQGLAQRGFEMAAGTRSGFARSESTDDGTIEEGPDAAELEKPPSKLRLIAFGISEKIYERE